MCTWPCRKWSVCFEVCLIKPSEVALWTQCLVIKRLSLVWPTFQRLSSGQGRGWVVRGGGSSSALGGNCVHALMPHARIYTLLCSITSLIRVTATLNTPSFLSPRFQLLRGLEADSPANGLTGGQPALLRPLQDHIPTRSCKENPRAPASSSASV